MNIKKILLIISFAGTVLTSDAALNVFSPTMFKNFSRAIAAIDTKDKKLLHVLLKENPNLKGSKLYPTHKSYGIPLISYALRTNPELLNIFLHCDTNPDLLDSNKNSPLHWAAIMKNSTNQEQTALMQLFDAEANPNIGNIHQNTALFWAIRKGILENIVILLKNDAHINIQNIYGSTPLHHAVEMGNIDALRLLLEYGANPNIQNQDGYTPLFLAVTKNSYMMINTLLDHKANPFIENHEGDTPMKWAEFNKKDIILHIFSLNKV